MSFAQDARSGVTDNGRHEQKVGLHRLVPPPGDIDTARYTVNLIFVHGLGGHYLETWTHQNRTCWPRDLLHGKLPGARVYSYGYPSKIFANKSLAGIREFAAHLLYDIKDRLEEGRPIIFICHSLGGIVVKQAMIMAHCNDDHKAVLSATAAIIFMGTPHRGSTYADYGKVLADIANAASHISLMHRVTGGVRSRLIEGLKSQNLELRAIADDFVFIAQTSSFQVANFFETEAHPFTNKAIVDDMSAKSGAPGEVSIPLYLHHSNLCRFYGLEDDNFRIVLYRIKCYSPSEAAEVQTVESSLRSEYAFDESEKICIQNLNTLDIAEHEAKVGQRVKGTLEWVLQKEQYTQWTSSPTKRILWVTGYAGTGKTVLSSFITHKENERRPKALVCRFFCDSQIDSHRDDCAMLRSLIYQLADQKRKFWRMVKRLYETGGSRVFRQFDSLWNLFGRLASSEVKRNIVIIIDALDELKDDSRSRTIKNVLSLVSSASSERLKVFLTSRPTTERAILPQQEPSWIVRLSLWENQKDIDNDIRCVIDDRLQELVKRGVCSPKMRDSLSIKLVKKADQTFLWVNIVLALLEKRRLLREDNVHRILGLIPGELESLYTQLLQDIPDDDQYQAASILHLLVLCDRPPSGDEIGMLLTIKPHHDSATLLQDELEIRQNNVQSLLDPLVRVHGSGIELVHVSLKEYLLSLSNAGQSTFTMNFAINPALHSKWILERCWLYLSLKEFQHEVCLSSGSDLASQDGEGEDPSHAASQPPSPSISGLFEEPNFENLLVNESTWLQVNEIYCAFDFVALHWVSFFRMCEDEATEEDVSTAISLCQTGTPIFRNWFHYYWLKKMPFEPLPADLDVLTVVSILGHRRSLERLLASTSPFSSQAISSALFWAAHQGHNTSFITLLQYMRHRSLVLERSAPLLVASQFGLLDSVKFLITYGNIDINEQDGTGRSALYLATANNHLEVVELLLTQKHVDVNLATRNCNTPLHVAIDVAAKSVLESLLTDPRIDVGKLDRQGRSILSWAAELGLRERVSMILKHAPLLIEVADLKGRTPLSYAAQKGQLPIVQLLVEEGHADAEAKDASGRNILSWAASQRNLDVLRYLLGQAPESKDIPDNEGWAPIAWTLDAPGYVENFRTLLSSGGIDVNRPGGELTRSLLAWITNSNNIEMAEMLITFPGIALDMQASNGRTPLSVAAEGGRIEIVQMLVNTGNVNINAQDHEGRTPLMWAAKNGHVHTIKVLLACHNIEVEVSSHAGETALDIARQNRELAALLQVKSLVQ